jgi:MYXO-CTERM domain-containing protein
MTTHRTAALALVLGLACSAPVLSQTTGGTGGTAGSTSAPSTTASTTAPVGGDRNRDWDWGWLGLLGLIGLAGLRRPRDTTLGGTGTTRTGAR